MKTSLTSHSFATTQGFPKHWNGTLMLIPLHKPQGTFQSSVPLHEQAFTRMVVCGHKTKWRGNQGAYPQGWLHLYMLVTNWPEEKERNWNGDSGPLRMTETSVLSMWFGDGLCGWRRWGGSSGWEKQWWLHIFRKVVIKKIERKVFLGC